MKIMYYSKVFTEFLSKECKDESKILVRTSNKDYIIASML
jgi:hypothetical protein